jgi:hypothetical protein
MSDFTREVILTTCNWCEGTGLVGKIIWSEQPEIQTIMNIPIRVDGVLVDQPCSACNGSGSVPGREDRELARSPRKPPLRGGL